MTRRGFRAGTAGLVVGLVLLLAPRPVLGQDAYAPTFVPPDHWSVDAVRRLGGLGLLPPGQDVAQRMATQQSVGAALDHAAGVASPWQALAAAWAERFRREFAARSEGPALVRAAAGSNARAGWSAHEGRMHPGWGYGFGFPGVDWNQPYARPDAADFAAGGTLQLALGPAAARVTASTADVSEAYGVVEAGAATLWLGRREFAWGPSTGPGLVMNGGRYDSFGVQTAPVRLPWVFRHLGVASLELALGQEDFERSFENAGFLATRGSLTPHRRFTLGVSRAAFFGGDGNTEVDLFAILSLLIGKHAGEVSELDNQLVAVDASWAVPTERWLPLRVYLEWGFEDSAGAFKNVPGILAGVDLPAVPGVPALAVAVEHVTLAGSCCGNPIWYRHSSFVDGWTQDGRPLGHPLSGHGREWRVEGRLHPAGPARAWGNAFTRHRGEENLFADARIGDSRGGAAGAELDLPHRLRVEGSAFLEDGEEWREWGLRLGLRAFL